MKMRDVARLSWVEEAVLSPGAGEKELRRVTSDSRKAGPETAFFALPGRTTDGHRFLEQAGEAGAPALFLSDPEVFARLAPGFSPSGPDGAPGALFRVAQTGEPRPILADLVSQLYGNPSSRVELLGVTGTNGKGTVTFLAAQTLAALGQSCGIVGGLGFLMPTAALPSERTTPESPDIAEFLARCSAEGVGTVAMEVSSIGIHQERTRGLSFRSAAYTNFTRDHLDYHGSMGVYGAEKERLFTEYALDAAVMNLDDPTVAALAGKLRERRPGVPLTTFGLLGQADLTATELGLTAAGSSGILRHGGRRLPFALPLPGAFNVSNWLAALGLLLATGRSLDTLVAAAPQLEGAPGRLERVAVGAPITVLVDYAHTPAALETVLGALRPLAPKRLAVLFGCGGDRDRLKRPHMGAVAERLADCVVLTSDNPRSEDPDAILAQVRAGMRDAERVLQIRDRQEAIHTVLDSAQPGDLVLLAGKGSETYQEIQGRKLPFDDREIVKEWSRGRFGG